MPGAVRAILILIPISLAVAALGVWISNTLKTTPRTPEAEVQLETTTVDGIAFEVEFDPKNGAKLASRSSEHTADFSRSGDFLTYYYGLVTINELGLSRVKAGDTVRWNLSGPVLLNGEPMQKHALQARFIESQNIDAHWQALESPYPRDTLSIAWLGSTRLLAAAHGDGVVRIWDLDKLEVVKSMTPEPPKTGGRGGYGLRVAAAPNGKQIAIANMFDEVTTLLDVEKAEKTASFTEPKGLVSGVGYAKPDALLEARGGKLLLRPLSGSGTTTIGTVHEKSAEPFAVHSQTGLVGWNDGAKLRFGPLANPATAFERTATANGCCTFSADGSLLAEYDGDNRLSLLDPKTGKDVMRLRWRGKLNAVESINALAFSPDGKTLAAGGADSIRFYDVQTGRERGGIASPYVRCLAYSADGRTLAAGLRYQPGLRLWKTEDLVAKPAP